PVNHRVRRRALLGKVHDGIGPKFADRFGEKFVIGDVTDQQVDRFSRVCIPRAEPLGQGADGSEGLDAQLKIPLTAYEIIDDGYIVAPLREIQRGRPAAVTIATEHGNPHVSSDALDLMTDWGPILPTKVAYVRVLQSAADERKRQFDSMSTRRPPRHCGSNLSGNGVSHKAHGRRSVPPFHSWMLRPRPCT